MSGKFYEKIQDLPGGVRTLYIMTRNSKSSFLLLVMQ